MSSECIENVKAFAILLCGIGHPQNIGAILRSSYYLGVDRVYTTNCKFIDSNGNSILKSSAPLTPSVSKASSGVLEIFQPTHLNDPEKFVEFVKSRGWFVIGSGIQKQGAILKNKISTQSEDSVNTNEPRCHQKPQLLVIGNEGFGIPQKIGDMCDRWINIEPGRTIDPDVDSLNVSVACALLINSLMSQSKINR